MTFGKYSWSIFQNSCTFGFTLNKPPIFDNLLTFSNDYSHYFGEVTN